MEELTAGYFGIKDGTNVFDRRRPHDIGGQGHRKQLPGTIYQIIVDSRGQLELGS